MSRKSDRRHSLAPAVRGLGEFDNFSSTIHGLGHIFYKCPRTAIQQAIVDTMLSLNGWQETRPISVSGFESEAQGKMGFEVGVGHGIFFDHLDEATAGALTDRLTNQRDDSRVLDFLLLVTYHYQRKGKMSPVRFDHHHLRFFFREDSIEVLLHHARGTRRLPLDELLQVVFRELTRTAARDRLGEIKTQIVKAF